MEENQAGVSWITTSWCRLEIVRETGLNFHCFYGSYSVCEHRWESEASIIYLLIVLLSFIQQASWRVYHGHGLRHSAYPHTAAPSRRRDYKGGSQEGNAVRNMSVGEHQELSPSFLLAHIRGNPWGHFQSLFTLSWVLSKREITTKMQVYKREQRTRGLGLYPPLESHLLLQEPILHGSPGWYRGRHS